MKVNWKVGVESEGLKHQFSQVESDLNLQEMLKLIPIKKKTPRKKDKYGRLLMCSSSVCSKSRKKEYK
jgi:hypothetical protein